MGKKVKMQKFKKKKRKERKEKFNVDQRRFELPFVK